MTRWLIFAEGDSAGLFDPLDQLRPPYLLRNGAWTIAERWSRLLSPARITAVVRPLLAELVADQTHWQINQFPDGRPDDVWIIAGAASPRPDPRWETLEFPPSFVCVKGSASVIRLDRRAWSAASEALKSWLGSQGQVEKGRTGVSDLPIDGDTGRPDTLVRPLELAKVMVFQHAPQGSNPIPVVGDIPLLADGPINGADGLWDLVNHLPEQLQFDRDLWTRCHGPSGNPKAHAHDSAVLIAPQNIWFGDDTYVGPQTVIDASQGPVILDKGVVLEPFVRLDGPAFVGAYTRLVGGKITGGCAFGPGCRIGGEVEASIVQGFSNKVHEGFFGHGFLGEWVNLGALTTNSDLKNNYGSVRVERCGKTVDTGCMKVGSYLSDHVKTAIGTLLPTGSTTGVGGNLLSGGLAPKSVPSFVWGGGGQFTEHRLDRMLETARAAMARRGVMLKMVGRADQLSGGEEKALRGLYANSMEARASFLRDQLVQAHDHS